MICRIKISALKRQKKERSRSTKHNKMSEADNMESPSHKMSGVPEGPVQMLLGRRNTMKSVCSVHKAHLQDKQYVMHDITGKL